VIVEKSTVPVNTGREIEKTIKANNKRKIPFDVASNPEFLSEGEAINNFINPDRIVIGVRSKRARDMLLKLYEPLKAPILVTDIESAEIIKHASNSFLATKISFINAVRNICEKYGADVVNVAKGMGLDRRIGRDFLNAGVGFGGFCFPKDLDAFMRMSEKAGYDFDILKTVKEVNDHQKARFVVRIEDALGGLDGKTIAILGLAFNPNTDDMRYAPSIDIIHMLKGRGAKVKVFDPKAIKKAKKILTGIVFCKDVYSAVKNSDCVAVITDWDEFKEMDLKRVKRLMKKAIIADGRNMYNPKRLKRLGFKYIGVGR
jgi:UDPglucose 6-dehydrogenase